MPAHSYDLLLYISIRYFRFAGGLFNRKFADLSDKFVHYDVLHAFDELDGTDDEVTAAADTATLDIVTHLTHHLGYVHEDAP